MENLNGTTWKNLTTEQQHKLLLKANAIDGITGNNMTGDGECIIDLTECYSVAGSIVNGEKIIEDNAIIYNPAE